MRRRASMLSECSIGVKKDDMAVEPRRGLQHQTHARILQGKLPGRQAVGITASSGLLAASGVALLLFRHILPSQNPFSAHPHPLWPWAVMLHVLASPFFFFFVGSVWWQHAVRHWQNRNRRLSGILTVSLFALGAVSGYSLYFAGGEFWLSFWRALHGACGLIGIGVYGAHVVLGVRALARAQRESRGETKWSRTMP